LIAKQKSERSPNSKKAKEEKGAFHVKSVVAYVAFLLAAYNVSAAMR
jgi:hypothetical protein